MRLGDFPDWAQWTNLFLKTLGSTSYSLPSINLIIPLSLLNFTYTYDANPGAGVDIYIIGECIFQNVHLNLLDFEIRHFRYR